MKDDGQERLSSIILFILPRRDHAHPIIFLRILSCTTIPLGPSSLQKMLLPALFASVCHSIFESK